MDDVSCNLMFDGVRSTQQQRTCSGWQRCISKLFHYMKQRE